MAMLRITLVLFCALNFSLSLESARNQYEDVSQLFDEATDTVPSVQKPVEANLREEQHKKKFTGHEQGKKYEKILERLRNKRSIAGRMGQPNVNYYNPWGPAVTSVVQLPAAVSTFSMWRPQVYQISRPYFIPVWGSPGRIPLFFPPQPIYTNTGFPADNPPTQQMTPDRTYLPSKPDPFGMNDTLVPTMDKFGDGPVWDSIPNRVTTTSTVAPTRRTRRPGERVVTHPPLVHGDEKPTQGGSNPLSVTQRPISNTIEPPREATPDANQPTRCVWAIISCCSTSSESVSYSCFEQQGCTGAFWDMSPCESEFARAAVANVMKFYNAQ